MLGVGVGAYGDSEHVAAIREGLVKELDAIAKAKGIDISLADPSSTRGSKVANCYTLGDVYGTANTNNKVHIGGFTGMAGAFQYNCYAMGNVTSSRPTIDIGIMDGRIANVAYDRNCYFNSDAKIVENGVVIESVYTGADGTGSSKDVTFGKTAAEIGSQEFADILNANIDNVVKELEAADEELGGIMSIYYNAGPSGLNRWVTDGSKAVFGSGSSGEIDPDEPKPQLADLKLVTKWGNTYCVDDDGTKLTGFQTVNGQTYFFSEKKGVMKKSSFFDVDGSRYYALKDGIIARNMKVSKWGTECLFGEDGKLLTGFNSFNGDDYYSKENGAIVKPNWIRLDEGTYYAKADGHLAKNETIKKWGKKYTFDENGKLK